jgi:hypothetical protein
LLALVTFGPFAIATLIFYASPSLDWLPRLAGTRELVEPVVPLPASWLEPALGSGAGGGAAAPYRWSLIYARMAACEQQCLHDLERVRQVQRALGRDTERVARIFLTGGDSPPDPERAGAEDPALATHRVDGADAEPIVRAIGAERLRLGRVLIADPLGNLIASYPPEVEQKELLRDLKRLLSVSGTN